MFTRQFAHQKKAVEFEAEQRVGLVGLALVFKRGRRNVDVFLEQQRPIGRLWSASLLRDASSQPAAFSQEEPGNSYRRRQGWVPEQPNSPVPHLPGAATAARLCRRGAQPQPAPAAAWAGGKGSQHRELGDSFVRWGELEGDVPKPSFGFCGD